MSTYILFVTVYLLTYTLDYYAFRLPSGTKIVTLGMCFSPYLSDIQAYKLACPVGRLAKEGCALFCYMGSAWNVFAKKSSCGALFLPCVLELLI
jgi:hypothetical protein